MWTRRAFLKSGGLAVFATGLGGTPTFLLRTADGAARGAHRRRKVLVSIFQRGAMDGLAAVQPIDATLQRLRPRLALDPARRADSGLIDLGVGFGLHPALGAFRPFWEDGRLAVVHGMGSPEPNRSHFDAQDFMETGTPGDKTTSSGWLNRAVGAMGHDATPFRAVSLSPMLPRALQGPATALAVGSIDDLALDGGAMPSGGGDLIDNLDALYEQTTQGLLQEQGRDAFEAARLVDGLDADSYRPEHGADYSGSRLGRNLRQIAQLIKADVGLEIAFAESSGWDTHVAQGGARGTFARRAEDFAQAIAAFWTDLRDYQDDVVVMTMTEFGRTVAENGSGGTDHGRGSCLFVLGNDVRGGQVHGRPLELDRDALEDGRDLPVTTDFRSVFAGVAGAHLGVRADGALFPGWDGRPMDLLKG